MTKKTTTNLDEALDEVTRIEQFLMQRANALEDQGLDAAGRQWRAFTLGAVLGLLNTLRYRLRTELGSDE